MSDSMTSDDASSSHYDDDKLKKWKDFTEKKVRIFFFYDDVKQKSLWYRYIYMKHETLCKSHSYLTIHFDKIYKYKVLVYFPVNHLL